MVESGSLSNTGTVIGGTGFSYYTQGRFYGAAGGTGVALVSNAATVTDSGVILGGAGGANDYPAAATDGGIGVSLSGGKFVVSSDGTIIGGAGGYEGYAYPGPPQGGAGVSITHGGRVANAGSITGGQGGGTNDYVGGAGGAGVFIDGGKLTTSGTITGGAGGVSTMGDGAMGAAVQFGTLGGTLVVDPGAVFNGAVLATGAAQSTLELAGTAPGTLSGFGTNITGLTTISEDAHANWVLGGGISSGTIELGASASLTLSGAVNVSRIAFSAAGADTLVLASPGEVTTNLTGFGQSDAVDINGVRANSLSYSGGKLTLYENHVRVDALAISGPVGAGFGLSSDGHGGTDITVATHAFASPAIALLRTVQADTGPIIHGLITHMLL